jgi:hypothetical protein
MPGENLTPLCYSASDLAELLRVSVRQVHAWRQQGKIGPAPLKLSERVTRWDAEEIRRWWGVCLAEGRMIGHTEWQRRTEEVT